MKKTLLLATASALLGTAAYAEDLASQRQSLETPAIVIPHTPPSAGWCAGTNGQQLPAAECAKYFAAVGGTVTHYGSEECEFHQGITPQWMIRWGVCQSGGGGGGGANQ